MEYYFDEAMRCLEMMDSQHWAFALIGAAVIGFMCMRGFGSRAQY